MFGRLAADVALVLPAGLGLRGASNLDPVYICPFLIAVDHRIGGEECQPHSRGQGQDKPVASLQGKRLNGNRMLTLSRRGGSRLEFLTVT